MKNKKFHTDDCDNCRILASYETIQKEHQVSTEVTQLQEVKLEILEKLIKGDKCPLGHDIRNRCG